MLQFPEISDPATQDGTTAFVMALARSDSVLAARLLKSSEGNAERHEERERDTRLARDALLENSLDTKMRKLLTDALEQDERSQERVSECQPTQLCNE